MVCLISIRVRCVCVSVCVWVCVCMCVYLYVCVCKDIKSNFRNLNFSSYKDFNMEASLKTMVFIIIYGFFSKTRYSKYPSVRPLATPQGDRFFLFFKRIDAGPPSI